MKRFKSIRIDAILHGDLKEFLKESGIPIVFAVEKLIRNMIKKGDSKDKK